MDKLILVYSFSGILYSNDNEQTAMLPWMNLTKTIKKKAYNEFLFIHIVKTGKGKPPYFGMHT